MGGGVHFPPYPPPPPVPLVSPTSLEQPSDKSQLHAVVDLGSNGIRCTITDLSPPTTRILPTRHSHRVNISLYDAQFNPDTGHQIPIPHDVIAAVAGAIMRFQLICIEIGVPTRQIRILATEATRRAINGTEFVQAIEHATDLRVDTVPREQEGRIGAWGIASGFADLAGLALDMGGGSMQVTWMISHAGNVQMSPKGSISFPYGAAALTQHLEQLRAGKSKEDAKKAEQEFRAEMERNFRDAFDQLEIPDQLLDKARREGGFQMYLSGGGFRGWGYLLLYLHQAKKGEYYPISIINGFTAPKADFENTKGLEKVARTAHKIFRVSDRRRRQVPSVAFLVNALAEAVPHGIKEAHFCQGGVREGVLFQNIPPVVRQQNPLVVATIDFARPSAQALAYLMFAAVPRPTPERRFPPSIRAHLIQAFANALYMHAAMSKELASTAALYSTSGGVLAATHGLPHTDRARLALMLQARYGGELPPREQDFRGRLRDLLTSEEVWWIRYLGRIGLLLSRLYPVGVIDPSKPRVVLAARWANDLGKRGDKDGLKLRFSVQRVDVDHSRVKEELERDVKKIRKAGKKKHWIGGRNGWGMKVSVDVVEEDLI